MKVSLVPVWGRKWLPREQSPKLFFPWKEMQLDGLWNVRCTFPELPHFRSSPSPGAPLLLHTWSSACSCWDMCESHPQG